MPENSWRQDQQIHSPAYYRILVLGAINGKWADCFAGMALSVEVREDQSVISCLQGRLEDQGELTGVLNGLVDLNIPILSVTKLDTAPAQGPPAETDDSTD